MTSPCYKNSYLQLECAMKPEIMNQAISHAMHRIKYHPRDKLPPLQRLTSMQPSLYAPWTDITRAQLGFMNDLHQVTKDIKAEDAFVQLQAIHSIFDKVQITEKAMYLVKQHIPYRLIDLLKDRDPIIREKVLLTLLRFTTYYQAKIQMLSHAGLLDNVIFLFMRDRKEIRYAAALFLNMLSKYKCTCEAIMKKDGQKVAESLVKSINNEHKTIIIIHVDTLKNLAEWDPVPVLKANAFQAMKSLMIYHEYRLTEAALECMIQLCKHKVGKKLADKHDLIKKLMHYLVSPDENVIISALGLLTYTTLTTKSKWRVKELTFDLIKRVMALCESCKRPLLQLRGLQVLLNLCDCPDARAELKQTWAKKIKKIEILDPEEWDGSKVGTPPGLMMSHYYRTTFIPGVEGIRNDLGDNRKSLSVFSYLTRVHKKKAQLMKAINAKTCVTFPGAHTTYNERPEENIEDW